MAGIWYDYRQAERLRDEAPCAHKDIRAVARAQRELLTIARIAAGAELQGAPNVRRRG